MTGINFFDLSPSPPCVSASPRTAEEAGEDVPGIFSRDLESRGSAFAQSLIRVFFRRSLWLTLIFSLLLTVTIPGMLYVQNMAQYQRICRALPS